MLDTPSDNKVPKIKTGTPVPIAKKAGKVIPSAVFSASGISTAKKRTALYGQNARAKSAPRGNPPIIPQSATLPPIADSPAPDLLRKGILSIINIKIPITIKNGPITGPVILCKKAEIIGVFNPMTIIRIPRTEYVNILPNV